jgi:hypothetical protein
MLFSKEFESAGQAAQCDVPDEFTLTKPGRQEKKLLPLQFIEAEHSVQISAEFLIYPMKPGRQVQEETSRLPAVELDPVGHALHESPSPFTIP